MDYSVKYAVLDTLSSDCLVLGVYHKRKLTPMAEQVDGMMDGLLGRLLKRDDMEGKAGDVLLVSYTGLEPVARILLVGLGKKDDLDARAYRKALLAAAKVLKTSGAREVHSLLLDGVVADRDAAWKLRQQIEVMEGVLYRYTATKGKGSEEEKHTALKSLCVLAEYEDQVESLQVPLRQAEAMASGMRLTRDLANLPGNHCTPSILAEHAEKLAKQHKKLKADILDEKDMSALGMGSLLSVSRGSREPAKLIVLEYDGGGKEAPIVLIGKGLTFDAGGISLKPAAAMDEMKYDMSGGAAVLGVMQAVAEMRLQLNLVGIVAASENLPDGQANKPGDVVTSMAGITIEILNTDAEGRLLLCDALTYAKRFEPRAVIDIATLTGACVVSLGRKASGMMGNNDRLCEQLQAAGEEALDRVWRMPIWDEYQDQLKSNFADVANIGGPEAGSITAACFLSRFAKDYPWAHLDIAGTAWNTGADKGATARPVPLLMQYLLTEAEARQPS
ncbi:MAG: aminopeptidase [Pseudomonadota bacterium]